MAIIRLWRDTHAALGFANLLKLGPRAAIVERRGSHCCAGSMLCQAAKLDQRPGERDSPVPEIMRCRRRTLQNGHNVVGLQRWTDSSADRLSTVPRNDLGLDAERVGNCHESNG